MYGLDFWDYENDGIVESIYFVYGEQMPGKWEDNFGLTWDFSYNQWSRTLTDLGFEISATSPPHTELYEDRKTLAAVLVAKSVAQGIELELEFNYGNRNGDGSSADSPRSLYAMTINRIEY